MGSTGSLMSGKDNNIEINIADEAPSGSQRSMKRHNSQPTGTLFQTFIARQKHVDGSTRPPANIRSSGSFDPSSSVLVLPPEAVDKVKKEYDTFKFSKEQEIQELRRKEQKLDTENNRLRAELQALNKQCQKLRAERDNAVESNYEATERASALEQDREKIQRRFKIFRETKESEIQALLQARRQLESQLQRLQAYGVATIDDHTYNTNDSANLSSTSGGPTSEWWAQPASETTSLFGSNAQLRNGSHAGYVGSVPDIREHERHLDGAMDNAGEFQSSVGSKEPWLVSSSNLSSSLSITHSIDICSSVVLRCYVSATPDTVADLKAFLDHPDLAYMEDACSKEGYFLSIVRMSELNDYFAAPDSTSAVNAHHRNTVITAVSESSVFISFLGGSLGKYTEIECEEGHFASPGEKSAYFCIKNKTDVSSNDILQRVQDSSCRRVIEYSTPEDGATVVLRSLVKAVCLEFGFKMSDLLADQATDPDQYEVPCIDEMPADEHLEQMQQELISPKHQLVQPIGFEKCYERLDEVVTSPGPVPPLLVSGTGGSGKTLLLSSWMCRLKNTSPDIIILQHFITGTDSIDADPVIMLRRLLSQLLQHLPLGSQPPIQTFSTFDVMRLRDTLPRWLEQFSSRRNNRILLVIDSLDLLKEPQRNFHWLLDPLNVGVRVVFSVTVDSCPEEWRQFPTLHLEPLSIQSVKLLLNQHATKRNVAMPTNWERDVMSQCRTATTCHPLYVTLLSLILCSLCEGEVSENFFGGCLRTRDPVELYRVLLRELELQAGGRERRNRMKSVLQYLTCSKNGLAETEILSLIPDLTWSSWIRLRSKFTTFCIIKEAAGLFTLHNSEVSKIVYDTYVVNKVQEGRCQQSMLRWLREKCDKLTTPRSSDLFLWMLHKKEDRETLLETIGSPVVFNIMYTRGRACEIVALWNYLNVEKTEIPRSYRKKLKELETSAPRAKPRDNLPSMTGVAQIYQSLGRFLKDLNLMEEAVSSLQKSLEILESVLDPDHPAVADSLHHLASVYAQWGKLSTAEPLYRQALELIECTVGREHIRVAQELAALMRVVRKSGRQEMADGLQQRMVMIMKKNGSPGSNNFRRAMRRALRLEELTLDEDSLETAQALNDLGVLYHMQNSQENAESFFRRSLKTREKVVGHDHADVAQSYHNLAAVYNEKKQFPKAAECMNTALIIRKKLFSDDDPRLLMSMKYLAVLFKKTKNLPKSAQLNLEILEFVKRQSGANSVAAANAMSNLAVSESLINELDSALPHYENALEIYRKSFGNNSTQACQTLRNIAVLLYNQGNMQEAARAYKQSLAGKGGKTAQASW